MNISQCLVLSRKFPIHLWFSSNVYIYFALVGFHVKPYFQVRFQFQVSLLLKTGFPFGTFQSLIYLSYWNAAIPYTRQHARGLNLLAIGQNIIVDLTLLASRWWTRVYFCSYRASWTVFADGVPLTAVFHWGNILATCSMLHCWTGLVRFHWFNRRQHVACDFVAFDRWQHVAVLSVACYKFQRVAWCWTPSHLSREICEVESNKVSWSQRK